MSTHADPASGCCKPGLAGLSATGIKRDKHPEWFPPTGSHVTGLKLLNSLTETVEPFVPINGRMVKWYTCGPTVYDMSHMGHARAYLTFDIMRRVIEDYFQYPVQYQMNITDIDDKIIKRARVNKLVADFKDELKGDVAALERFVLEAVEHSGAELAKKKAKLDQPLPPDAPSRLVDEREEKLKEMDLHLQRLQETRENVAAAVASRSFDAIFRAAVGPTGELLDVRRGASISDHSIFDAHAKKFEREFFEDCARLGIREPDCITRVSECVPSVVKFIEKIIANGFAYVGESSVFFDTEAYIKAGHSYPKLKPVGDKKEEEATEAEMAEGEGALSGATLDEKRSKNDFALWKFSKPGEPRWPSPWGEGRPGWHIECSVMASDVLGENMDIHAGGCDLKFPHHDNECAQSEAYWGHHQWVNYFLHCGHLHIKGLKMSKSLKNFITIRQALEELGVTAREMRLLFLSNRWDRPMNFSDQSLGSARERERVLRAFFGSVDIILREDHLKRSQSFNEFDMTLNEKWVATEAAVHAALCNNVDTVSAMDALMALVADTNAYFLDAQARNDRPSATLVRKIGRYITRMLQVFGVVQGNEGIGFAEAQSSDSTLVPVCDALVKFRDQVRQAARDKQPPAAFLPLCDALRDELLPPAGVRLEDKPDGPTQWKLDDPQVLMREIAQKKDAEGEKVRQKLLNTIDTKKKLLEKWSKFTADPKTFFSADAEYCAQYAAFDPETGLPIKDKDGTDVDEKKQKKLKKEQDKYAQSHAELAAKGGPEFLNAIQSEIDDLVAQLKK